MIISWSRIHDIFKQKLFSSCLHGLVHSFRHFSIIIQQYYKMAVHLQLAQTPNYSTVTLKYSKYTILWNTKANGIKYFRIRKGLFSYYAFSYTIFRCREPFKIINLIMTWEYFSSLSWTVNISTFFDESWWCAYFVDNSKKDKKDGVDVWSW